MSDTERQKTFALIKADLREKGLNVAAAFWRGNDGVVNINVDDMRNPEAAEDVVMTVVNDHGMKLVGRVDRVDDVSGESFQRYTIEPTDGNGL